MQMDCLCLSDLRRKTGMLRRVWHLLLCCPRSILLAAALQEVLEPNELEQLMAAQHQPAFVLHVLSELVWGATLMEGQAVRMDEALTFFGQQVGTCERCGLTARTLQGAHSMQPSLHDF